MTQVVAASQAEGMEVSGRVRSRMTSIATLAVAHTVNDSYSYVLPALLPAVIPALGLTLGMAGGLVALYQVTSSLVQPFVGYQADRRGLRWLAWVGLAAAGIGAGLIGRAPSYAALTGLLVLAGCGSAIFHPVAGSMVGGAAPEGMRGRWMGMFVTAGNVGTALGPLALGLLLERGGLAGTWPITIPALILAIFVAFLAPRPSRSTGPTPSMLAILRQHRRVLSALIAVVGLRACVHYAILTFVPLLSQMRGLSLGSAAQTITVYSASATVGGFVGGFAADRWGRDRVIVASLLLCVPFGLFVALRPEVDVVFYLALVCCGFCLNASFVVLTIRGQETVPGSVGMVTGITLGFTLGLGGLSVAPLAMLAERIGLPLALTVAFSMAVIAAVAMRLLPPSPARSPEGAARPA